MITRMSSILQGGRLAATRKDVVRFISSVHDDKRIAHATVLVNEAHVIALARAKAIKRSDARKLLRALRSVELEVPTRKDVEDVHVVIEEYVTKRAGRDVGGQLHFGKSRNDQAVTAIRMVLRDEMFEISGLLLSMENRLLRVASKHLKTVFPGYTHLQPAQPISFAHYLVAMGDSFIRDNERILQAYKHVNMSPMGSGALAGSSVRLDRRLEARLLGFNGLIENSLDAVGSRDFILETLSVFSIIASNLSRLAQDIIFFSSADVGLLSIDDAFTSTSSIMPQKKNPDPLELIRAKSATVLGDCSAALTIMHGLPSGYNLDFQEMTPLLWDACDTLKLCLGMLAQIIPGLEPNPSLVEKSHLQYTTATEIANILVAKEGMPFRKAHRAVGHAVRSALAERKTLSELTGKDWELTLGIRPSRKTFQSIARALQLDKSIESYHTRGSPNVSQVAAMVTFRTRQVRRLTSDVRKLRLKVKNGLSRLGSASSSLAR